jgi:hypothetical protein
MPENTVTATARAYFRDQAAAPAAPAKVEPITTATVTKPAEAKK